ncbi:MAG: tRNA-dihydrouridine synthase family protein [Bdellovibrionaceae bacterium]|nr:tRNA-dihydrouridine synthase family protein [Pseudobdellovibrionaceae bacterium]
MRQALVEESLSPSVRPARRVLGLERAILGGEVNFPVCLAPMVGLSHVAFRRLVREYLPRDACTIWPTEMLNSRRLPNENLRTTPETLRAEDETQLVPQILGNEEKPIRESVARLIEWGASGIDINMGCPVKKALMHNYGVALMGDPQYAADVVRMTVRASRVPISVKLRATENREQLLAFVDGIQDAGASWITLHPRTAAQKRRGTADWVQIRDVRERLKIPVIGNGDIQTADDALAMLQETGCDLAMVGRALTARPWLLWQVGEKLGWAPPSGREGRAPATPEEEGAECGRALKRLLVLHRESFDENLGLRKFRFLIRTGSPWLLFGHDLYARSTKAKTYDQLAEQLDVFFSKEQSMAQRTDLVQ